MSRTGIIIQARLGSTRLPAKVLVDIGGKPVLQHVIERARRIPSIDEIVVAYPYTDFAIDELCFSIGCEAYPYYGDMDNVLDRYYQCAKSYDFENIVRITADCPLLDPDISDMVVSKYLNSNYDYVTNRSPMTWPDGLDTEIFSFWALMMAHQHAKTPYQKEHVTAYMYGSDSPMEWTNVPNSIDQSNHRWTLDTSEDLAWIRDIYEALGREHFGMADIMRLIHECAWLKRITI